MYPITGIQPYLLDLIKLQVKFEWEVDDWVDGWVFMPVHFGESQRFNFES